MRSVIDPNKTVTPQNWVVSLVVKPKGKNPEHAILIVEGISRDKKTLSFKRYDFVMGEEPDGTLVGAIKRSKGRVDSNHYTGNTVEQSRCFWSKVMHDMRAEQGCHGLSWNISDRDAINLDNNVQKDVANPPDYQISGEHAVFAASSSQSGHNCFTWARGQLKRLGVEAIDNDPDLKVSYEDLFAARTSRHLPLVDPESATEPTSGCRIL